MTKKRFKLDSEIGFIDTQKCGGDTMTLFEVVVELNKLDKENEQLKKILGFLRNDNATDILNVLNSQENQIMELKKENEQLKQDLEHCANQFKDDGKNVLLGLK